MKPFPMALPKSVEEAVAVSGKSFRHTQMLAGGTDLLAELKERVETPELVVNLKRIVELRKIRRTERGLEIGALVTLTAIAEHQEIAQGWPALVEAIQNTATPQLRNVGTIGGNLCQRPRCWYYRDESYLCRKKRGERCYALSGENEYHSIFNNDVCCATHPSNSAPVLMAYDALLEIAGPDRKRLLPIEEFFVSPDQDVTRENILQPNEVLTTIILPPGTESRTSAYVECREKQSFDWSLCGATINLRLEGNRIRRARIVLSAVAPTPLRRRDLEELVLGRRLDEELVHKVGRAAVAKATPLEHNRYKVSLLRTTVRRALQQAMKG